MNNLNKYAEQCANHCSLFFVQNQDTWKALPYFVLITFLLYFSSLSFFAISIDGELAAARVHSGVWISQGRWTTYIVEKFLFGRVVVPFMPTAVFCFAASVSYIFILIAHDLKVNYITYLSFPFFCAFPIWRLIGSFSANLPSVAWGLLACSIAAYLFKKASMAWACRQNISPLSLGLFVGVFAQAFLVATAVGAYQSYILVFGCFGLGIIIRTAISDKPIELGVITRMLMLLAASSALGLLLYSAIESALLYLLNIKVSYIQSFYDPRQIIETPFKVIIATLGQAGMTYSGSTTLFGAPLTGVFIVMLLGIYSVTSSSSRLFLAGLIAVILIAPFTLSFIAGFRIPLRTLIAVPYVVWLFAIFALENRSRIIKILTLAAITISISQILYISSQQAAAKQLAQQQDFAMAALVYNRIASVNPDFDVDKIYRVDFFGGKKMDKTYPTGKSSTAGGSFFGWDGGRPKRMVAFMRLIGYPNLETLKKKDRLALIPHYQTMPVWPAQGSVTRIGDITLIKLSDAPGKYEDDYE